MISQIKSEVSKLLCKDNSGHGMEHIERVLRLSLKFAEKEDADKTIVALIALLHDVDDYKLFGEENAKNLINAKKIMNLCNIDAEIQKIVCSELSKIGYSKRLNGIAPTTKEGKIVSDADMCDAVGVNGIIRAHQYSLKMGCNFFDKNIFPKESVTESEYKNQPASTTVCHAFEKILKLKNLMLTESGKQEATERHNITVDLLNHLFDEEDAPEWKIYLKNFLDNQK